MHPTEQLTSYLLKNGVNMKLLIMCMAVTMLLVNTVHGATKQTNTGTEPDTRCCSKDVGYAGESLISLCKLETLTCECRCVGFDAEGHPHAMSSTTYLDPYQCSFNDCYVSDDCCDQVTIPCNEWPSGTPIEPCDPSGAWKGAVWSGCGPYIIEPGPQSQTGSFP